MSKIEVDTVEPQSGTSLTLGASGDTITIPAGATLSSTDPLVFPAGTALLPAITTTGDTNTGIFFPAADTIAFTEGGTEAMRIDSSGNVGIGIVNPSQKLHVEGAGSTYAKIKSTNDGSGTGLYFQNATGNYVIGAGPVSGGSELAFYDATNSAERMRIHANGAVLIGATLSGSATAGDLVVNGGVFIGGTATANELDDYEEGTWTPTDISGASLSFTGPVGNYVKIGKWVTISYSFRYPSTADGTAVYIGGLPFTVSAGNDNYQGNVSSTDYGSSDIVIWTNGSSSGLRIRNYNDSALSNANLSGKYITGQSIYYV